MKESLKANICAALSRADVMGKDLCFIRKDMLKEILWDATPQVLKLQEIPEHPGAVWLEHRGVKDYIEPALYRYEQQPFFRFAGKDHAWGIDLNTASYNMDWRAWTHCPTEDERKEVPWK